MAEACLAAAGEVLLVSGGSKTGGVPEASRVLRGFKARGAQTPSRRNGHRSKIRARRKPAQPRRLPSSEDETLRPIVRSDREQVGPAANPTPRPDEAEFGQPKQKSTSCNTGKAKPHIPVWPVDLVLLADVAQGRGTAQNTSRRSTGEVTAFLRQDKLAVLDLNPGRQDGNFFVLVCHVRGLQAVKVPRAQKLKIGFLLRGLRGHVAASGDPGRHQTAKAILCGRKRRSSCCRALVRAGPARRATTQLIQRGENCIDPNFKMSLPPESCLKTPRHNSSGNCIDPRSTESLPPESLLKIPRNDTSKPKMKDLSENKNRQWVPVTSPIASRCAHNGVEGRGAVRSAAVPKRRAVPRRSLSP